MPDQPDYPALSLELHRYVREVMGLTSAQALVCMSTVAAWHLRLYSTSDQAMAEALVLFLNATGAKTFGTTPIPAELQETMQ